MSRDVGDVWSGEIHGREIAVYIKSEVVRFGLSEMLRSIESGYDIVDCRTPESLGMWEYPGRPDLVVLGCDGDDLHVVDRYAQNATGLGAKVLILLSERDECLLDKITHISSNGYLVLDDLTKSTLADTLRRVFEGEVVLPPMLAQRLLNAVRAEPRQRQPIMELTPRERQSLELLVEGMSNKQIARRLRISSHGAKRLVANVLAKLNCSNRTLAVSVALQEGLLDEATPSA